MKIVKKMIKKLYIVIKKILSKIFLLKIFKIDKKKIVFDNFIGKGYGCNPKYIAEEIIREKLDYDLVWLVNDLKEEMPKEIRKVKYGSIKALYELATARIWIDNVRNYNGINKKRGQYYIQTWHGGIAFKGVEKDVEGMLSKNYVKQAKYDGSITDLMITNNKNQEEYMKQFFWYNGKIECIGLPKYDIIYNFNESIKEKVYQYFNIDKSKRIIMYAPTFRNDFNIDIYKFDYMKCCEKIKEKFGNEYVMLLRLHPNIAKYSDQFKYDKKIINGTDYPDVQELTSVIDVVITDYSSLSFEAALVDKPVFLFAKDLDEYVKNDRKLIYTFEEMPFSLARNEQELFENISKFSEELYYKDVDVFFKKIGVVHNKNASKDIVNIIKNEMLK